MAENIIPCENSMSQLLIFNTRLLTKKHDYLYCNNVFLCLFPFTALFMKLFENVNQNTKSNLDFD